MYYLGTIFNCGDVETAEAKQADRQLTMRGQNNDVEKSHQDMAFCGLADNSDISVWSEPEYSQCRLLCR